MSYIEKLKIISTLLQENFGFQLIASDTHRWCGSDGFYEVSFKLFEPDNALEIYLSTASGGQELEDQWSPSNPQSTEWHLIEEFFEEDDAEYALNQIKENLPDYVYTDSDIISELFDFYTGYIYVNEDAQNVFVEDIDFDGETNVGFKYTKDNTIETSTIKDFLINFKKYND